MNAIVVAREHFPEYFSVRSSHLVMREYQNPNISTADQAITCVEHLGAGLDCMHSVLNVVHGDMHEVRTFFLAISDIMLGL